MLVDLGSTGDEDHLLVSLGEEGDDAQGGEEEES